MMKHDHDCRQAQLLWMERFDAEGSEALLAGDLPDPMRRCPACRRFAEGAASARSLIAAVPLPPSNSAADRALLAALSRPEPAPAGWSFRLAALFAGFGGAGLRPVLIAGAASFLITLAAGAALTLAPVAESTATAPAAEPAPTRRAERDLETRLEDWIARPATRPRPPQSPQPTHRRTVPPRPRERSDRSLRSHAA